MRVAAFTRYDSVAASTRQRILQYVPYLRQAGIMVDYHPLLGNDYLRHLAAGTGFSKAAITIAYARRVQQLLTSSRYELIWVYAELFPYLPGGFERLAFRAGKPVVYDFDDAFFLNYEGGGSRWTQRLRGKFETLIAGAAACCCGNAFLQEYAKRFSTRTIILPTVVDADIYRPEPRPPGEAAPVIGWIGSPSTYAYLRPMLPLLQDLARTRGARIKVVGAGRTAEQDCLAFPALELVPWAEATEVAEVQSMDIGIMPLPDEPWARGKSGYKLIQYMACGLPVVASPVGVNREIVREGTNGFLAAEPDTWRHALLTLLDQPKLRLTLGAAGRADVLERYSLRSQAPRLITLMREVAGSNR